MKTSTLTLRPFVPGAVGTDQENMIIDEPIAKLVYGGVTIELPIEVLYGLKSAISSFVDSKTPNLVMWQILSFGLEEIRLDMVHDLEKRDCCIPEVWHRDNPNKCSLKHHWNPLYLDTLDDYLKEHFDWDKTLKDHADTTWQTNWRKEDEQ